jgi:hypothetical protein
MPQQFELKPVPLWIGFGRVAARAFSLGGRFKKGVPGVAKWVLPFTFTREAPGLGTITFDISSYWASAVASDFLKDNVPGYRELEEALTKGLTDAVLLRDVSNFIKVTQADLEILQSIQDLNGVLDFYSQRGINVIVDTPKMWLRDP